MRKIILILSIFNGFLCFSQEKTNFFYINTQKGEIQLIPNEIEIYLKNKVIFYENKGFPFTEVKLENIKGNKADLIVNTGELYTIDSLIIVGNTNITEKQLFNLIGIRKGDIYIQKKLDNINKILEETPYLKQTKEYSFVFHNNSADIYFYLEKVSKNYIDGLVGFSKDGEKITLNGDLNLRLQNTLNQGEVIQIDWNSIQDDYQKMKGDVFFPSILNSKIGSSFNLDVYKKHHNFTNTHSKFSFHVPVQSKNHLNLIYQKKISISEQDDLENSNINTVGLGVNIKLKNWEILSNNYFGIKANSNKSRYTNLNLKTNYKINVSKKSEWGLHSNTELLFSENLQENELLFIGGSSSLKGFKENEIRTSKFSVFSSELTYKLDNNTSVLLFGQHSFYRESNSTKQANSIGIGTDLKSRNRIIYLQYAIGFSKDKSFNFQNGMIHVGIKNTF